MILNMKSDESNRNENMVSVAKILIILKKAEIKGVESYPIHESI